jgi:hypothetical protein
VWLVVFTWTMSGLDHGDAVWSTVTTGLAVAVASLIRVINRPRLAGLTWINATLGAWLIVSPFLLSYGDGPRADALTGSNVVAGGLVVIAAAGSEIARLAGHGRSGGKEGQWKPGRSDHQADG